MNTWFVCLLLAALALAGCTTKSGAEARARAAFLAGQQQGMAQAQARGNNVEVRGNVKTHLIPWTDDLTLIKALLAAEYQGTGDPSQIIVVRQGQATSLDPKLVLRGEDMPLQAGDVIDVRQ